MELSTSNVQPRWVTEISDNGLTRWNFSRTSPAELITTCSNIPSPRPCGDHDSRSDSVTWGIHLVAGLGSHWVRERGLESRHLTVGSPSRNAGRRGRQNGGNDGDAGFGGDPVQGDVASNPAGTTGLHL